MQLILYALRKISITCIQAFRNLFLNMYIKQQNPIMIIKD